MPLNMDWMRQNEVNILKYLPAFPANDKNFKAVADSCSTEHEFIRQELQDIFQQFFVTTATWGLVYWERILDIVPNQNDTYVQRRKRILLRLQSNQTSTIEYMTMIAKRYFNTAATVKIEEDNANYAFRLIADAVSYDMEGLIEAIDTYKPAHLALVIVHYLSGDISLYSGGIIETLQCIAIAPAVDFSIEVSDSNLYESGTVAASGIINIF